MNRHFTKIVDITRQRDLDDCENATGWSASADTSAPEVSTTHITGKNSISFGKTGTTETTATVSKTIGGKNGKDCCIFALHRLRTMVNLSAITDIVSVSVIIGTDATDNNVYTETGVAVGWNELNFNCDDPTTVNGDGVNWKEIKYLAVTVTFGATANTLTDILIDSIELYKSEGVGDYSFTRVRAAAILTGSYVPATIVKAKDTDNQAVIYWNFTKGSLDSGELKVEFSNDMVTWAQETFSSVSGGVSTETLGYHTQVSTGVYRLEIPFKDKFVRVSVKGTGTVTGSSATVDLILGKV